MARTRTQDERSFTKLVYQDTDNSGVHAAVTLSTLAKSGYYSSITDEVHPNFRKRMKQGELMLGDMQLFRTSRTVNDVNTIIGPHGSWGTRTIVGDVIYRAELATADPVNISDDISSACDAMLIKAYAKMKQAEILSGEGSHDLNQTLSMLKRPFSSAQKLVGQMVSRKAALLKATGSVTKAIANTWLEYRYGWKPLIMDCEATIKEFNKFRSEMMAQRLVARAGLTIDRTKTVLMSLPTSSPFGGENSGDVLSHHQARIAAGVIYDRSGHDVSSEIARFAGLRPCDFPATVWEIIPYSFVVDWFVNVGDWISAITPIPGITVRGNWVTYVHESTVRYCNTHYTWTLGQTYNPDHAPATYTGSLGSSKIETTLYSRACNLPITLAPTMLTNSLTSLHSADACALLVKPIIGLLRSFTAH